MQVLLKVYAILVLTATAAQIHTANAAKYLAEKPDFLIPCSLKDPNFEKCLPRIVGVIFHEWKDGIPGFKSFGSIDPHKVKRIVIAQDPKNPVALNAELSNIIITGISKAVLQEVTLDTKTLKQNIHIVLPKVRFDSDYKIKGHLLNLVLNGNGKSFFEVENLSAVIHLQLKLRDEHGHTFTDIDKFNLEIKEIGGLQLRLDNLFNGQKVLEDSTNAVFNENWREFYDILKPAIQEGVQAIMGDRLTKAYSYVPANFFVSDIPTAAEHSG